MYWLSAVIDNTMLGHIKNAKSSHAAWTTFENIFFVNTKAQKIQLKQELYLKERNYDCLMSMY